MYLFTLLVSRLELLAPGLREAPADSDNSWGLSYACVWTSLDGADRVFVEFICSVMIFCSDLRQSVYKRILCAPSGNRLSLAEQIS